MTGISTFLLDPELLVPIKIDITYKGARYVDSFCWKLYNSVLSVEDFASRTSADLSLPAGFQYKIALQMDEQIASYRDVLSIFYMDDKLNETWQRVVPGPMHMLVGIRFNSIDCKY